MTKHYKVTVAFLTLFLSAFFSASAATTPPKVVFIGDIITYSWTSAFAANPNWVNKGSSSFLAPEGDGSSGGVWGRFQSDVVSLHPAIVHIMVGSADASAVYDSDFFFYVQSFFDNLDGMVKEARAANIKVVLGMEAQNFETFGGNLEPINEIIAAYGAANNIPVVNYGDALCGCVGTITPGGVGTDANGIFGNPLLVTDADGDVVPSSAGYALMTQMAENAIATMNLTLKSGHLQNVLLPSTQIGEGGTRIQIPNVNSVGFGVLQFTPQALYSDGIVRPLLNSTLAGSSGTWTSSNPLVMYISQKGLATSLTPGTTTISYTSPNGVRFSPWVMYVGNTIP